MKHFQSWQRFQSSLGSCNGDEYYFEYVVVRYVQCNTLVRCYAILSQIKKKRRKTFMAHFYIWWKFEKIEEKIHCGVGRVRFLEMIHYPSHSSRQSLYFASYVQVQVSLTYEDFYSSKNKFDSKNGFAKNYLTFLVARKKNTANYVTNSE